MYKRKLQALSFPNSCVFNASDDKQFRNIVVWLEDQKIRRYKIEERESLRQIQSELWEETFRQYLIDLDCPITSSPKNEILDWLLGLAVHFEFSEKPELYSENKTASDQFKSVMKTNPLDNLDFGSDDFILGVNTIADLLKVPRHIDHLVTLEAISNLVKEHLNEESRKNPSKFLLEGTPIKFDEVDSGFSIKENNLNQAAGVLRYLFIHDLRELQTKINECIVSVQSLTANPKTDTKLGKVGY